MGTAAETAWIVERAGGLGFALCGVTPLQKFAEHEAFAEWLGRGYAGEMTYLADARRSDPGKVLDATGSVIVCAMNYNTAHPYSTEAAHSPQSEGESGEGPRGWISRYAWGNDYHQVVQERLNALVKLLIERFSGSHSFRAYADTGPVAERIFAKHAGLGWIGKNTLLLNEKLGSWFFLGVVVTSLELAPSLAAGEMPPADLCGNCRQCLDACPTQALIEPYVMDARLCISYLTIELRGSIPAAFREAMGRHVYGCDICQDVCPYNREAPLTGVAEFAPRRWKDGTNLLEPQLEWLVGMGEEEFRKKFRGSAIKRTKWRGLVRNACIALGNAGLQRGSLEHGRIVELLERLTAAAEPGIAESARWALSRIR